MPNKEEINARKVAHQERALAVEAAATQEARDLTADEAAEVDSELAALDRLQAEFTRLERLESHTELLSRPAGRKAEPDDPAVLVGDGEGDVRLARTGAGRRNWTPSVPAIARDRYADACFGFRHLGDFALSVRRACIGGGMDRRLELSESLAAATTYGSEGSGADGGFAVPPEFRSEIMTTIQGEDSLLARCDQVSCTGNNFTQPVDETTPWQTSGGILATWDGEAQAANQSKPQTQERTVKLNKLRVLVPLTEEILEDAAAMDSYLRKKAPQKILYKINAAIVSGGGSGMPLGILNSPARITVAKESGQLTGTFIGANATKMYARMYGPSRSSAVWLYNQEIEPQLYKLSLPGTDNTGAAATNWGQLIWIPPGGVSSSPYSTLMGRPMIPTQACSALSTEGDIIFADLSQYLALLKSGPNPRVDVSMHLWFDQDLTAYKFTLRMGGLPWWSTPMLPAQGANTLSAFVTLQTR